MNRCSTLGRNIKAAREATGKSIETCACEAGVTRQGWAWWEGHGVGFDKIDVVAQIVATTVDVLLGVFPTPDAKALAAVRLYEAAIAEGMRRRGKVRVDGHRGRTRDLIAEKIDVPPTTIARARRAVLHAAGALGKEQADRALRAVELGRLRLSALEQVIKAREEERREMLERAIAAKKRGRK